jgi:hypothetical protein
LVIVDQPLWHILYAGGPTFAGHWFDQKGKTLLLGSIGFRLRPAP